MLVLSRKVNQQIQIGDNVVVTVVRIGSDKVRIGIEAPTEVNVLRGELLSGSRRNSREKTVSGPATEAPHHEAPHHEAPHHESPARAPRLSTMRT